MHTIQIGENSFLIDLRTGGYPNLFASYVLKGSKTVIVDPGPSSSFANVLSGLHELGIKPENVAYFALSHVHVDHSGSVGKLLRTLPNAKVIAHSRGVPHLIDPEKLWVQSREVLGKMADFFGRPESISENRIVAAFDNMEFEVAEGNSLKVVETPGHASHHLSYFDSSSGDLFPGDAAGIYLKEFEVVLPTSPPPFRPDAAVGSLHKLLNLNPKKLCYPHFGQTLEAIDRLRKHEQQIILWVRIAEDGVRRGQNTETIRERILLEDASICKIVPYLRSHPIFSTMVLQNSCDGIIEFVRRQFS